MDHRAWMISYRGRGKSFEGMKLRKMYGHALNRDYDGVKIFHRRKKWLKNRLVLITLAAKHRREMMRLAKTKLSFFEKRILDLGGQVSDRVWDYKSVLNENFR